MTLSTASPGDEREQIRDALAASPQAPSGQQAEHGECAHGVSRYGICDLCDSPVPTVLNVTVGVAPAGRQADPASMWTLQGHQLATSGKAAWACRAFDPDAGEGGSWSEWRLTSYEPPRRPDRWFEVVALPALAGQHSERPAPAPGIGILIALTREKNKLHKALEIACNYLTDEQAHEIAAAMPDERPAPAGQAVGEPPSWVNCETRGRLVRNSLQHCINDLRKSEKRARDAYTKPFMGEPCAFMADAYAEAAAVFERRLAASQAERPAVKEDKA